jgi:serine/threonine-protein kinase
MDAARWERIQSLFHVAADLPEAERRAALDAPCADDPTLVDEVLALLEEDARGGTVITRGLRGIAEAALAAGAESPIPSQLGPYRLVRLLGEGGMGVVYLAQRTDLKSEVAIKILRDAWLSPARRERFASEQRMLAQLNHPSIARLYDADTLQDGTPWFAMEYVDGVPLTDYCAEHALSITPRLELFRAVCEAVLHAHRLAVIHRDLKPSNILVTRGGQPKLLDFGIAKQLEDLDSDAHRTRTELRLMTPAYAAPEQLRGEGLGVYTDVYALGTILYELLTGRHAFDLTGRSGAEAHRIITEQEPERPSIVARRAATASRAPSDRGASWADLDVLCLTAMQKDPARRYRTVDSLIRDVDHYLRGEPLEARPDTIGYRVGKFVRRNARTVFATAAAAAIVIGLVGYYTVRLASARNAALAEAQRTRRIQEFMNGLFEGGGDEDAGPADTLRVVSLLGRGVQEAGVLGVEPQIQGELYQTLGVIYQNLGDMSRADTLLERSLDVRRRVDAGDRDVGRSLVALGLLRADQSRLDDAEKLVREGLDKARRLRPAEPAEVARATTALGAVLGARGDYDGAIATLTEAARLDSLARMPAGELSATLTQLANSHFYAGNYGVSDSLNRRILELDRGLYGDRHPHVASDLINLGAVQQERGNYAEAERYHRQALDIYRRWYGEQHYETAAAMTMVGRALIPQGRLDEASQMLRQALTIRETIYGPYHSNVASTVNELARIAQQQGRLDEAEAGYRRMADIYHRVYGDKHYLIGVALSNLGSVATERKQYREAEQEFRRALAMYAETLPADHPYVGNTRIRLGRALLRANRFDEAERETRAGYDILMRQSEPSVKWLQDARKDLVAEYTGLDRPDSATKFRQEFERAEATATPAASK